MMSKFVIPSLKRQLETIPQIIEFLDEIASPCRWANVDCEVKSRAAQAAHTLRNQLCIVSLLSEMLAQEQILPV